MGDGRVLEQGTHWELTTKEGHDVRLVQAQKLRESEEDEEAVCSDSSFVLPQIPDCRGPLRHLAGVYGCGATSASFFMHRSGCFIRERVGACGLAAQ